MKLKKFSMYAGGGAIATLLGVGAGFIVTDIVDAVANNRTQGLPLVVAGAHLKEGTHRVVVTDQFADLLKDDTVENKKMIVNAMTKAYDRLNDLCDKIKFDFCTTATSIEELGVKRVEKTEKDDIRLYLTESDLNNNSKVLAKTDWNYHSFSRELYDETIKFKKSALMLVYKEFDNIEERNAPLNTIAYTITIHETMHAMGFAHIDDKGSIMYPYISVSTASTARDLSKSDEDMIKKYNEVFYNANIDDKCSLKEEDMIL